MKRGDEIELRIESLAFGGEGVGRHAEDNKSLVVFVEDTVPGDFVRVNIGAVKRNFARGYILDFIEKAPLRIAPRCKHFGQCGGCVLQYLGYGDQLKIKEQQVRDAMRRIGGFSEEIVRPIIGCKDFWHYRNKMEFSFSRDKDGKLTLGLHVRRRHHDIIELTECFLLNDYAGRLVAQVRDFFRKRDEAGELSREPVGGPGPVSLIVREGKNSGEIMINLVFENGEPGFLDEWKEMIMDFFGEENFPENLGGGGPVGLKGNFPPQKLSSVYFTNIINKKGSPKSIQERLLWGSPVIHEYLHLENGAQMKFEISPQSFFQPNTVQAEVLYGEVLKAAALNGSEIVFDLFCGAGTIGSFCAHAAKKVIGIEMNESAVKNAEANAALNGINNIEFLTGDVAKQLPLIKEKPDVVIVDPPRNGMDINALNLASRLRSKRIVYVSCNPTTLARDLKLFTQDGYKPAHVQPVDMFPHTYHIENVAVLELAQ
jgi:23S rRNA (uracil1939-C5)-methyltransferase